MSAIREFESPFDYVIVGAGSAGCVLAARLSEAGDHRVAVLEAGGSDRDFWITAPLGLGKLYDHPKYNWLYETEPEKELAGTRRFQPRGKVLGGTSSINGLVHIRGNREDFNYWRQLGNVGWGYDDVLPYFKRSEDYPDGDAAYHGRGGPLKLSRDGPHELADAFIAAAIEAGHERSSDFNGAMQDGFGYDQVTIRNGRRSSCAVAYLRPASRRRNLRIIDNALASRIVFHDRQAVGVEFRRGGETFMIRARREVIVSAGSFNSPQLLQLSGVGPQDLLRENGVAVVADRASVGAGLQDHFNAGLTYRSAKSVTVSDIVNNPVRRIAMGVQYILFHNGLMATNGNCGGGFIRTDPSLAAPDVKLRLKLWSRNVTGRAKERMGLNPFSSFGLSFSIMHPDSRGSIRIKSADSAVQPEIRFNYFVSENDRATAVKALREMRRIMTMPAIQPYVVEEVKPGLKCSTDAELIEYVHQNGTSGFHSTSSCAMGADETAAVDPRLRVRGVGRLRVIDASIMPRVVAGNTNAATIMIGEKGADLVLEDAKATPR